MFFILSKTLGLLLEPLIIPYLCLLCAVLAKWRRRRRLSQILLAVGIMLPLLYGVIPLSNQPVRFLENRIQPVDLAGRDIDGIIVLGGFTGDGFVAENRNQPTLGSAAERFTAALHWHNKYPDKPLVFSGFSGRLVPKGASEAEIVTQLLDHLMIDRSQILFEDKSRNTYENARNSLDLIVPAPGSRWLLITSASHMPRAIGSFRAAGWSNILSYPVDYQTPETGYSQFWDISRGVSLMRIALHEYAGLLVYWLSGRSSALLPS